MLSPSSAVNHSVVRAGLPITTSRASKFKEQIAWETRFLPQVAGRAKRQATGLMSSASGSESKKPFVWNRAENERRLATGFCLSWIQLALGSATADLRRKARRLK